MAHNVQTPAVSPLAFAKGISLMQRSGAKIMKAAHTAVVSLQSARMMSVLSAMSDHELARIGITRADIPAYAAQLMVRDQSRVNER